MSHTVAVICPFYITHSSGRGQWSNTITCEDIRNNMGFIMRNQIRFINKEEQKAYMDIFCCSYGYEECPYYKALYKKYHLEKAESTCKIESKRLHKKQGKPCGQISMFDINKLETRKSIM